MGGMSAEEQKKHIADVLNLNDPSFFSILQNLQSEQPISEQQHLQDLYEKLSKVSPTEVLKMLRENRPEFDKQYEITRTVSGAKPFTEISQKKSGMTPEPYKMRFYGLFDIDNSNDYRNCCVYDACNGANYYVNSLYPDELCKCEVSRNEWKYEAPKRLRPSNT